MRYGTPPGQQSICTNISMSAPNFADVLTPFDENVGTFLKSLIFSQCHPRLKTFLYDYNCSVLCNIARFSILTCSYPPICRMSRERIHLVVKVKETSSL